MTVLRALDEPGFTAWREPAISAYAADKVASGQWSQAVAIASAQGEFDELLPQGRDTPGHHFFAIVDERLDVVVGTLWFAVKEKFAAPIAYVFDIQVLPAHRRQGHAQRALRALEVEAEARGLSGIALHVFGHNTGAQALYARLGFEPTNISLFKAIGPATASKDVPHGGR